MSFKTTNKSCQVLSCLELIIPVSSSQLDYETPFVFFPAMNAWNDRMITDRYGRNIIHTFKRYHLNLTLSQISPCFYMSAVQVF